MDSGRRAERVRQKDERKMLVACTGVGQYGGNWLLYSTASIYNVADAIVISDGSPFGHFQDRYMSDLEKLDVEGKIRYVETDWKYPPHPYAVDLGLPIDEKDYSSGRVMKAATDEARKLGCDRILWYSPDHVFDESIKDAPRLTQYDSYRCHYYGMADFDTVIRFCSDEEYTKQLENPDFQSSIILMPKDAWMGGLEGCPGGVTAQFTVRHIWFGHCSDFSPKGWEETKENLEERGRYRAHILNRAGKFDHFWSPEEEGKWVADYVSGYLHSLQENREKGRKIGEKFGLPRPIRVVKEPFKYVKEGYP